MRSVDLARTGMAMVPAGNSGARQPSLRTVRTTAFALLAVTALLLVAMGPAVGAEAAPGIGPSPSEATPPDEP
ncbi:MAG: hypothetical protein ACT4OI_02545, partial [Methanobacteriota archaeon]